MSRPPKTSSTNAGDATLPTLGGTIERYEIIDTIGQGALGNVYLARDPKMNREVALKVLSRELDDPRIRERFQLEARAIATLAHPNVVEIYDYADDDSDVLYLVMEHVPGPNLADLQEERGILSEQVALCIARELATALEFSHQREIVHRDIKPENIVVHDGRVVLLDFGSIKVTATSDALGIDKVQDITQAIGTPGFMAPEQFLGRKINARTDLYALGAVIYNITTRELPYYGEDLRSDGDYDVVRTYKDARRGRYRDPRDYQPLLSAGFCDLLSELLAPDPAERIESASEVGQRIDKLLVAHGVDDVAETLRKLEAGPDDELGEQGRTVDAIMRDLEVAVLRELVQAVRLKDSARTRKIVSRMERLAPMFGQLQEGESPVRRLRRPKRRRPFFLLGFLAGAGIAIIVSSALPDIVAFLQRLF